jgi:hypothetical protein
LKSLHTYQARFRGIVHLSSIHHTVSPENDQFSQDYSFAIKCDQIVRALIQSKLVEIGKIKPKIQSSPPLNQMITQTPESLDFYSPELYSEIEQFGREKVIDFFVNELKEQISNSKHDQDIYVHLKAYDDFSMAQIIPCLVFAVDFLHNNGFIREETTKSFFEHDRFLSWVTALNTELLFTEDGFLAFVGATDVTKQWLWTLQFDFIKRESFL